MDAIEIEVLEDGTVVSSTSKISQRNHMSAEAFMRFLTQACGGKVERKHKHGMLGAVAHNLQHALGKKHSH